MALLLGLYSFRYIQCDTEVFIDFSRRIVVSDATQKSDGAIGTTNPKFDVVVRPCADRILKLWPDSSFVFGKNRTVKAVEWNRTLAGIEAVEASVFVR